MNVELTRTGVLAALKQEPVHDDAGFHCQMCDRAFPSKGNLGVHQLTHRRAVGLAPSYPHGGRGGAPKMVICCWQGCTDRMNRSSLPTHVQQRHHVSQAEASFYAAKRRQEDLDALEQPALPATVESVAQSPVTEPVSVLSDIEASEAITGILRIARTDGLIPTQLLPDVYELIRHTDAVLHRLGELTR